MLSFFFCFQFFCANTFPAIPLSDVKSSPPSRIDRRTAKFCGYLLSFARTHTEAGESLAEVLHEGFRIVDILRNREAAWRSDGCNLIELELAGDGFHHFRRDGPLLLDISGDQGMFAEEIYDARNAVRIFLHRVHGFFAEDGLTVGAGDAQPLGNILMGLLNTER